MTALIAVGVLCALAAGGLVAIGLPRLRLVRRNVAGQALLAGEIIAVADPTSGPADPDGLVVTAAYVRPDGTPGQVRYAVGAPLRRPRIGTAVLVREGGAVDARPAVVRANTRGPTALVATAGVLLAVAIVLVVLAAL